MKFKVLAIKDRALDTFMQPFYSPAIGAAIRGFQDAIADQSTPMSKHPEDYDLYHLADFDNETGKYEMLPQPLQVAIGKQLQTH